MTAAAWLFAGLALAASRPVSAEMADRQACPAGWERVPTRNEDEPFHCRKEADPDEPFIEMTPDFKIAHCPPGSTPVETPGELQRFRCAADKPKPDADPDLAPVFQDAPPRGAKGGGKKDALPAPALEYVERAMPGVMRFDYPKGWHLTDAWNDSVPTLYIEYDTGRDGKQPTLVITKYAKGQEGWVDLDTAVSQEKQFQNAKELKPTTIDGLPARLTTVDKESRAAYVGVDLEDYYVLSYTAPEDLFAAYEPAFRRLTASFRLSRKTLEER